MKKQAKTLFIFSFISFILVFIFGAVLGPMQKSLNSPEITRNLNLFHNHFDQLCWLGAAAIGAVFYFFGDAYQGASWLLKVFTLSYITGTTLFSFAFLLRALGIYNGSVLLQKTIFTLMVSVGGLFELILLVCAFPVFFGLIKAKIPVAR